MAVRTAASRAARPRQQEVGHVRAGDDQHHRHRRRHHAQRFDHTVPGLGTATTGSKSRLNFLEVLRAGFTDYVINAEALAYMRQRALAGPVIASLAEHPERHFRDEAAWLRHLDQLGITALTVTPDPVRIATEGCRLGQHQGARPPARHGDPLRRCRPVRARPARPVLGPCRAAGAQARHLHRPAARGAATHAHPDLVL